MSRSLRKRPIISCCQTFVVSEKLSKRFSNRRLRRGNRLRIKGGLEPHLLREVSNVWCWENDGKMYRPNLDIRYYRK